MKKFAIGLAAMFAGAMLLFVPSGCGEKEETFRAAVSYYAAESAVESSMTEVVKKVADTVVEISTESVTTRFGRQYIVSGAGSGVIVGESEGSYLIVTNHHVIEGANDITVRTRAGKEYQASLVASDDSADIAVITVKTDDTWTLAVWGNSDELQIGEVVLAIGNPLGNLGGTVTHGILSATSRTIAIGNYSMTLLQTDAAINPGNSGGGLFNMRGQLIGVVNAKTSDEGIEGLCFAIPANAARAAYSLLTENGYLVGRATLGIELAEGSLSSGMGSAAQTVVYISGLSEKADKSFQQYDKIAKINGKEITSILDYNDAMGQVEVGGKVEVELYRGSYSQGIFGGSLSFEQEPETVTVTAFQYGA